jgi:hypothetical protein
MASGIENQLNRPRGGRLRDDSRLAAVRIQPHDGRQTIAAGCDAVDAAVEQ